MLKLAILGDLNNGAELNGGKSSVITNSNDVMSNCNKPKGYEYVYNYMIENGEELLK